MYAVRCDNPERPDSCDEAFDYSKNRNPEKAIERWNEYQSVGYLDDVIAMLEKPEVG